MDLIVLNYLTVHGGQCTQVVLEPFNSFCVIFMYWAEKASWTPVDNYTSAVCVDILQVPGLVGKDSFVEGHNVNKEILQDLKSIKIGI